MKICFVSFEYPPNIIGGSGVYAKYLTRELANLGHEIHVISPCLGNSTAGIIENKVFVHRIPIANKRFFQSLSFWIKLRGYYKELNKTVGGFDLLHSNSISDFSLSRKSVNIPRIVTVHHLTKDLIHKTSLYNRILNLRGELGVTPFLEKRVISRADFIVAVSHFTKNSLMSNYAIPSSRIKIIYNGVYPDKFRCSEEEIVATRDLLGLDKNELVYLFVGRIEEKRKNLPNLLKAMQVLCKERKKCAKLIIVGRGNSLKLKSIVKYFDLDKEIVFTGFVDSEYLRKIYNCCDVFVSPSILEGFGITLIEAMISSKPVIAFKVGATPELLENDVNGKIVEVGNIDKLVDAMIFFINNPKLIKKMGERNKNYVSCKFDWKKVAKQTEFVYKELVSNEC